MSAHEDPARGWRCLIQATCPWVRDWNSRALPDAECTGILTDPLSTAMSRSDSRNRASEFREQASQQRQTPYRVGQ